MKNVLITGASGGIGGACAKLFVESGYTVGACFNKNKEKAELLQKELGTLIFQGDISFSAGAEKIIKDAEEKMGQIDVFIFSSGIALQKLVCDTTDDDWNNIINTNLSAAFFTVRAVLPQMINRKNGSIIFISSMWGEVGASMETAYSASKAGIIGFTKALAKEVGPSGIRVNCITPGLIDTEMNKNLTSEDKASLIYDTPIERIGLPEDVAQAALFLASEKSSFITGQILGVSGGFVI